MGPGTSQDSRLQCHWLRSHCHNKPGKPKNTRKTEFVSNMTVLLSVFTSLRGCQCRQSAPKCIPEAHGHRQKSINFRRRLKAPGHISEVRNSPFCPRSAQIPLTLFPRAFTKTFCWKSIFRKSNNDCVECISFGITY